MKTLKVICMKSSDLVKLIPKIKFHKSNNNLKKNRGK